MIRDARSLPPGSSLDCDLCIVGGGAAGISLALELADTPQRVCLLESGGLRHERAVQALCRGESEGDAYPELAETRLAALGGSTGVWAGWCRPLDPLDFEVRDWVSGSGWPFGIAELRPDYERARAICGLNRDRALDPVCALPAELAVLTAEPGDLAATAFERSPLRFGTDHRAVLERSARICTWLHAHALRLVLAPGSERVQSVRAATLQGGRFDVTARCFVLAAGGIENARLLLLSGECPERSIGNAHGLVGRFFSDHGFIDCGRFAADGRGRSLPLALAGAARRGSAGGSERGAFTLRPHALRREGLLGCAIFFQPRHAAHPAFADRGVKDFLELWDQLRGRAVPGAVRRRAASALRALDRIAIALVRRAAVADAPARHWRTRALFECAPSAENRVELSAVARDAFGQPLPRIRWRFGDLDLRSARRAHQLLDASLQRSGLGRLELAFADEPQAWRSAADAGKHPMSSTRLHADPRRGVADPHGKVHGIANLYVSGSSVFPTGGFSNPTLTIVALAVRLAQRLRTRALP